MKTFRPDMIPARNRRRQRGISLVELVISTFILTVVVGIAMGAMVFYARVAKGLITHQRMQQQITMYLQTMTNEMNRALQIEFINSNRIRIKRPRYDAQGVQNGVVSRDILFEDLDNNPNTIDGDGARNRLLYIEDPTDDAADRQEVLLNWVSPARNASNVNLPIFERVTQGDKVYIRMRLRVGDRTFPTQDVHDRFTGPGYQSFYIESALIPINYQLGT